MEKNTSRFITKFFVKSLIPYSYRFHTVFHTTVSGGLKPWCEEEEKEAAGGEGGGRREEGGEG